MRDRDLEFAEGNRNEDRALLTAVLDGHRARLAILQGEAHCRKCRATTHLRPGGPTGAIIVLCDGCWKEANDRALRRRLEQRSHR